MVFLFGDSMIWVPFSQVDCCLSTKKMTDPLSRGAGLGYFTCNEKPQADDFSRLFSCAVSRRR